MPETKIKEISDASDLIVNGYAYIKAKEGIKAVNLRNGKAAFIMPDNAVSETSMDDIDLSVALKYLAENKKFME